MAEQLASLPAPERKRILAELSGPAAEALRYDWSFWARPKQLAPPGDWSAWVIRAGRGFGKTRSAMSWVHGRALSFAGRWIALVARTPADARDYMIEGPGGFLKNVPPAEAPQFEPSKRRLSWPNGSWATIYSDEKPDQLRGFSGDTAWLDEFAKFAHPEDCWDNLAFGMREASNDRPRRVVSTTPRPIKILRAIEALPTTRTVTGSSHENRSNLDPTWFKETIAPYEGTRLGRQEISAEILTDVAGALWSLAKLDEGRVKPDALPDMQRIVVGVDPASAAPDSETVGLAETGIVVAGLGVDGIGYVLADLSCRLSPDGWARRAISGIDLYDGDAIVAETNQGGAMVAATIRAVRNTVKVIEVHASRGKVTRAEPVAALYEQGRIRHVGTHGELEDQMILFTPFGIEGNSTGDRVDALVWALTELFPKLTRKTPRGGVKVEGVAGYRPHGF